LMTYIQTILGIDIKSIGINVNIKGIDMNTDSFLNICFGILLLSASAFLLLLTYYLVENVK